MMAMAVVAWAGCEAAKYSQEADDEVYQILSQRSQDVLGRKETHPIATELTQRQPSDVNGSEIILDRFQNVEGRLITLPESLDLAVKANRTYQFNREKLYLSALSLTGTRHRFAFKVSSSSVDGAITRGTDGGLDGSSAGALTLNKLMKAGGSITTSLANDLALYFDGKPKVPSLTMNLTQPLLRGAGTDIATEVLTQAERDVVYEVRSFSRYQKTFALGVVNDYLDLLQQADSMRIAYNNYTNRIYFQLETEARVQGGLMSEFEMNRTQQQVYSSKISYINATNTFQNSLDDFKQKLSLPLGTPIRLDLSVLDEINELGLPTVQVTDESGYYMAITNRLDFLNNIDRFEDSKRKVRVTKQDLLQSLSFIADASLKDHFYDSFQPENYSSTLKLKLDLPLDQLSERNAYRTSLINFERQVRSLATKLDELRDSIRTNVRNLARQKQSYYTQAQALENAKNQALSTQLRMRLGLPGVSTEDIIRAQDGVTQAEQSLSRALIDYHKTRLNLLLDVGELDTTEEQFWLKAGVGPAAPPEALDNVIPPNQILGQ